MGNSLRCCLACVLPCGALDVIRIVHLNGYVEEMRRTISAGEFLKSYPNHVLSKPCSQGMVTKILIMSPNTHLKRGAIYFLLPDTSLPATNHHSNSNKTKNSKIVNPHNNNNNNNNKLKTHHHHHHHLQHDTTTTTNKVIVIATNNKNGNENINGGGESGDTKCLVSLDLCKMDQENVQVCQNQCNSNNNNKSKSKSGRHQRRRSSRGKSGVWHPHLQSITEDF